MKKKLVVGLGALAIATVVMFNVALAKNSQGSSLMSLDTIEAQAGDEGCKTNPDGDKGICKRNVNKKEYNCVSANKDEEKDCYSD